MSNNLYMPLYIGDYLTDAAHLTVSEHGAYLLLIMNYWQRGEALPADDRKLAGIAKMTRDQWADCRDLIRDFFEERDGFLHHGRIDTELQRAKEKSAKARESASARHASVKPERCERNANAERTQVEGNALKEKDKEVTTPNGVVAQPAPKRAKRARSSSTQIDPDRKPTVHDARVAQEHGMSGPDMAREWPQFKNYHIAKGSLMADWSAAWRTWCGNFQKFKSRASPNSGGSVLARLATEDLDFLHVAQPSEHDLAGAVPGPANQGASGFAGALPERGRDDGCGLVLDLRPAGAGR